MITQYILTLSLWDLKQHELDTESYTVGILTLSLWDLKPGTSLLTPQKRRF